MDAAIAEDTNMASDRLYRRINGGVWYGWFYDDQKNRIRISTRCTNRRAAAAVLHKAEQAAHGVLVGHSHTLNDALEHLLAFGCVDCSEATTSMYEWKAGHLLRLFGEEREVNSLSMDLVRQYIATRQEEGAKAGTIAKELVTLRRTLALAKERGLFGRDPKMVIPKFRVRYQPRDRWLTEQEFGALVEHLPAKRRLWVLLAALAGPRLSEVERARWEDVDLDEAWLLLPGTKTQKSRRRVPIAPALATALREVKKASGPVIEHWHNVRRDLSQACAKAGIAKVTPNDLRRTFASWLKQAGKDSLVVARLLGHTSTRMVELVYGHLSNREYRDAVDALPKMQAASANAA
jgi:integrase